MKLIQKLNLFARDDSGAITVDWVVLTAAIVGLGIATLATIEGGVENLSGDIKSTMDSMETSTTF